ncbi:MAG TPA: TetR/AcrR family transcriptional regulator [Microbacterium sp.]|nr:TetR/AcrR family transcriptional regulator [Microbacterium sp.]
MTDPTATATTDTAATDTATADTATADTATADTATTETATTETATAAVSASPSPPATPKAVAPAVDAPAAATEPGAATEPNAGSAPEPRRGRPGYDRRGALEVAARVFNEHGYDATSMGMLAARLGLSKSAIYHHFASKEHLLEAALDEALGGLEQVLGEPGATAGAPLDRLTYVVRRAVEVLVERLPYVTLLLRLRGNTAVERHALARRRRFDDAVSSLVREAQEDGAVRPDLDPAIATRLVFGMVNSLVEWYRPTGPESASDIADDVLALVFDGLSRR